MKRIEWARQLESQLSRIDGYLGLERTPAADWSYMASFVLGKDHDGNRVSLLVPILLGTSCIHVLTAESVNEEVDRIEALLKSERAKVACTYW